MAGKERIIGMVVILSFALTLVLFAQKRLAEADKRAPAKAMFGKTAGEGGGPPPPGTAEAVASAREVVRKTEIETLEADREIELVCAIDPALPDGFGYLAVGGHSEAVGRNVKVLDGKAYIPYVFAKPRPDGQPVEPFPKEGWLAIGGFAPVAVAWGDRPEGGRASCVAPGTIEPTTVALPPVGASVHGTVTNLATLEQAKGAWVEGCGNRVIVEDDKSFRMPIVNEPCSVRAFRQPGRIRAKTEPLAVTPAGADIDVGDIMVQ